MAVAPLGLLAAGAARACAARWLLLGADRGAVGGVRGQLAGPAGDHPAARADRAECPAANTLSFTTYNRRPGARPAGGRPDLRSLATGTASRSRTRSTRLLFTVALWATCRLPPMPAGRGTDGEVPRGRSPGWRGIVEGLRLPGHRAGAAALVRDRHRRDGARHAAGAVPGGGRGAVRRRRGGRLAVRARSRSARCSAGLTSGWIGRVRRQGLALVLAVVGWGVAVGLAGLAHVALAGGAAARRRRARPTWSARSTGSRSCRRTPRTACSGRLQGVFIVVVAGGPRLGDLRAGAMAAADRRRRSPGSAAASPPPGWPWCSRWPSRRWSATAAPRTAGRRAGADPIVVARHELTRHGDRAAVRAAVDDRGRRPRGRRGRGRRRAAQLPAPAPGRSWTATARTRSRPASAGQILAPWPNRIRDGQYTFGARRYQLALTEPARHNAIHGLVNWSRWQLVERGRRRGDASSTTCRRSPGYPWPLHAADRVDGRRRRAAGRPRGHQHRRPSRCPFGFSVHPYLQLPGVAGRRPRCCTCRPAAGCWSTAGCCRSARPRWPAPSSTSPSPAGSAPPCWTPRSATSTATPTAARR